jgi:transketolase
MALNAQLNKLSYKTYVLLGDSETTEGSNWEAILFAPHHNLDNLTVIIDYNKIQALGCCEDVLTLEPLAQKLIDFHWEVIEIDGHNFSDLEKGFKNIPIKPGKPSCVIAHTVKGKGISFLENTVSSHYFKFNKELLEKAYKELGVKLESSI